MSGSQKTVGGLEAMLAGWPNDWMRLAMVHLLPGVVPLYVVNEFPKSGGTWVGQMLGRALGLPFPRNRLPVMRPSIMHGHYLSPFGMMNAVVPWRDGRDVMVSWYHQCLSPHEYNDEQVRAARQDLPFEDYDDVYGNLPAFIEWAFTRPRAPGFTWAQFARRWHAREDVVHVRYENLRRDTAGELYRVVKELTGDGISPERAREIADEFSFENQAGRKTGEENRRSFLRRGVVGEWRERFSPEARRVFAGYAGDELVALGYEKDHSWVEGVG